MMTILEVALGLAFAYLLFSLLASAINEAILGHLAHLRSRVLEESIQALLSNKGNSSTLAHFGKTFLLMFSPILNLFRSPKPTAPSLAADDFSKSVMSHPVIQGLAAGGRPCPSYLPAETFADAVVGTLIDFGKPAAGAAGAAAAKTFDAFAVADLAQGLAKVTDPHALALLNSVLAEAVTMKEVRERLTVWFNNSMDRVTGLYKRYTQFWLYVWATILVVGLNVDSIEIGKRLFVDAQFRGVIVASATAFVADTNNMRLIMPANDSSTNARTAGVTNASPAGTNVPVPLSVAKLQEDILKLKLPLGWGDCCTNRSDATDSPTVLVSSVLSGGTPCPKSTSDWLLKALGLIVTIAAISQGAPFWFDLLNRFTNLRATGKPPSTKPAT